MSMSSLQVLNNVVRYSSSSVLLILLQFAGPRRLMWYFKVDFRWDIIIVVDVVIIVCGRLVTEFVPSNRIFLPRGVRQVLVTGSNEMSFRPVTSLKMSTIFPS